MASRKPVIIDREHEKEVRVPDLSGGVNIRVSPTLVPADQARRLSNFSLREPGTLTADYGYEQFSQSVFGTGRAQGGARIYLEGVSPFLLIAEGGNVKKPSDAGVVGNNVLSGLSSTNEIFFPHDRDIVAVFDGANVPKKSEDGSTWTQMGIAAPANKPTLAAQSGGSLIDGNEYEVSYTYADDSLNHESNSSPVETITVTTPNLTIRVTVADSTDAQVDRKYIYIRNKTTGESVRRRVGSTTGTTFDIEGPDSDWEQGLEVPTTHDVPPAVSFGVVWKNRWWARHATVRNRLVFTELFQPQSWPGLFQIDIPFEKGDIITALIPLGDTLLVFGQHSLYLIIGQTSLDFEVRPSLGVEAGAVGPRAVARIEAGVVHAAVRGVYMWDGATDRLLSFDILPAWEDIVRNAAATEIARIACVYHGLHKDLHIAVPRLYPTGQPGEWILDLDRSRVAKHEVWTSTPRPVGGYIYWDGVETVTGNTERLMFWHTEDAHIYEEIEDRTADGDDLICEYESGAFSLGFTVARWIGVYGEYRPASGTLAIEAIVDGQSAGQQPVDIAGSQSYYGVAEYGEDIYGGKEREMFTKLFPIEAEGRTFVLKATYKGQAAFRLYTWAVLVVPEPLPRGM